MTRERYDLRRVDEELEKARANGMPRAIWHLIMAIAHLTDHVRAKERGDI